MRLKTFRRICQGVFFGIFLCLFFLTVYPFPEKIPVDSFLRLDPLVALVSMIASRAVISTMFWAGLVLLLALVFGRFFCGYVCPLGTLIDFFDFLLFRKNHKREDPGPKPNRNVKYFVLAGAVAASLLGANLLYFLSPMAIAPRTMSIVIFPPILAFINWTIDLVRPLFSFAGFDNLAQVSFRNLFFNGAIGSLVLFVFIIIANRWRRRFWCRYVCPTGALFSIFSRFGILKRRTKAEACDDCRACAMACDMRAIDADPRRTVLSECTLCGDCIPACKRLGTTIGFAAPGFGKENAGLAVGRRNFLYSAAAGLAGAAVVKGGLAANTNVNGMFIRPPGSLPESDFLARCIRCGECMKVCKTNGLQPAAFEQGIDGLWTPHLVSRIGGCEEKCNMCGHVCPTQAIRALPLEEKRYVKIGTAVIDRPRCIAWEQNKLCLICDEICPYDAVEFKVADYYNGTFKRPFVIAEKCTGCGLCETKCPTAGRSAIEIYSTGEERFGHGSYITEEKKKLRAIKESQETSYSADVLGSDGKSGNVRPDSVKTPQSLPVLKPDTAGQLPPGFTN